MHITVTTENDSCSIEVSEEMELENLKALCEAELNIPANTMTMVVNGTTLKDNKKTLSQLGVKHEDLVMILTQTPAARSVPSRPVPSEVAQFDFSSIKVPGKYNSTSQSSSQGSSSTQARQRGTQVEASASGDTMSTTEGSNTEDPEVIFGILKSNPEQLARLHHNNPVLADAVSKGLESFKTVLESQENAKKEKERQRIRLLQADPFDMDAQKLIAGEIEKQNIDANMEAAMEFNPESFGVVHMLYINCSVNGHPVKAFIDSGAQTTIMSASCAKQCNIWRLVDERWSGMAKGVGTQRIVGRIHMVQLEIAGVFLASSFSVLVDQSIDMLLGLDMLKRHQMVIDLRNNLLQIGTTNTSTPFLAESELPTHARQVLTPEEQTQMDVDNQVKDDESLAEALEHSVKEAGGSSSATTTTSTSTAPSNPPTTTTSEVIVSDADIAEIMSLGFTQEQAVEELKKHNNNKTMAIAALFAKSLGG